MKKILVVDIGNTSALFGLYHDDRLSRTIRIATRDIPARAVSVLGRSVLRKPGQVQAVVIASVVPQAASILRTLIVRAFKGVPVHVVGEDLRPPIANRTQKPRQVGIDRLMNAVAFLDRYDRDGIVVDFGTAITFDAVSRSKGYLGGAIAPGIEISLEALYSRTALLPKIRLKHPVRVIGRETVGSIRAGCSHGIGGLCDRLIESIRAEFSPKAMVVATGGYAVFMKRYSRSIRQIDPHLTLKGILLTYRAGLFC